MWQHPYQPPNSTVLVRSGGSVFFAACFRDGWRTIPDERKMSAPEAWWNREAEAAAEAVPAVAGQLQLGL